MLRDNTEQLRVVAFPDTSIQEFIVLKTRPHFGIEVLLTQMEIVVGGQVGLEVVPRRHLDVQNVDATAPCQMVPGSITAISLSPVWG